MTSALRFPVGEVRVDAMERPVPLLVAEAEDRRHARQRGVPGLRARRIRRFRKPEVRHRGGLEPVLAVEHGAHLASSVRIASAPFPGVGGQLFRQVFGLKAEAFLETEDVRRGFADECHNPLLTLRPGVLAIFRRAVADVERHDRQRAIGLFRADAIRGHQRG